MPRHRHRPAGEPALFLDGAGKRVDYRYGVYRARYSGRSQTTAALVAAKLGIADADATRWDSPRLHDVLLPAAAPDHLRTPRALCRAYEDSRLDRQQDLAAVVTLYMPGLATRHAGFELARAWAYAEFVRARSCAVVVVLHDPRAAGIRQDPHAHLVVPVRELGPAGFGAFAPLCRDRDLLALHPSWLAHRAAWEDRR